MNPIQVFFVDEYELVRLGLMRLLELAGDLRTGGEAGSLPELFAHPLAAQCDVIVLDLCLGRFGVHELVSTVRQHLPQTPVLALALPGQMHNAQEALQCGANGVLGKNASAPEFFLAIRSVARHGHYIAPEFAHNAAQRHEQLTPREREVLCWFARGHSVTGVATELGLSKKTISTHKTRIMRKFALDNNVELIRLALEVGAGSPLPPAQTVNANS